MEAVLDVLILRDPSNLFASRKKSGFYEERERAGHNLVIWKQHARVFAGERSYLAQPTVTINHNRWT